jgi:succinylglutamate-semialdehyde dehydrogenase
MDLRDRGNLIGGRFVPGEGSAFSSHDPAKDGAPVWQGRSATPAQCDDAIAAARRAFPAWSKTPLAERKDALLRLANTPAQKLDELAEAITLEMGKPIRESKGEAQSLIAKVKASITAQGRLPDLALDGAPGRAVWRPHGVMAVIGPSNYPIHLMSTHVAPALLAGNTVVLKPSRVTPLSGQIYAEIMHGLGLPDGVFNLVVGTREIGGGLVAHDDVDAIAFTGSWEGGRRIMEACLDRPHKLLALEMGGKNIAVVLDDAHVGQALHEIVLGACLTTGQRCTATSRLVATKRSAAALLPRLQAALARVVPGDPFADDTLMGPLATIGAQRDFLAALDRAEAGGAEPLLRTRAIEGGAFVTPSLFQVGAQAGADALRYRDTELFAPNIAVEIVDDDDAALERARKSAFGLSLSVFTAERARFERFVDAAPWGLFNWNRSTNNASGLLPFGGMGVSGNHRPAGSASVLYCSRVVGVLEKAPGDYALDPHFARVLQDLG